MFLDVKYLDHNVYSVFLVGCTCDLSAARSDPGFTRLDMWTNKNRANLA